MSEFLLLLFVLFIDCWIHRVGNWILWRESMLVAFMLDFCNLIVVDESGLVDIIDYLKKLSERKTRIRVQIPLKIRNSQKMILSLLSKTISN